MIKRLKWNVLHGGGGGEESDGGLSSSDDSEAGDTEAANALLAELVANDPVLRARVLPSLDGGEGRHDDGSADSGDAAGSARLSKRARRRARARAVARDTDESSDDDSDGVRSSGARISDGSSDSDDDAAAEHRPPELLRIPDRTDDGVADDGHEEANSSAEDGDSTRATWMECELCPGKRFLREREVEDHLKSKRHVKALARLEKHELDSERPPSPTPPKATRPSSAKAVGVGSPENQKAPATGASKSPKSLKSSPGHDDAAMLKRKAAVKRKLKLKKQRKWERQQQDRKAAESSTDAKSDGKSASKRKSAAEVASSENAQKPKKKKPKVR